MLVTTLLSNSNLTVQLTLPVNVKETLCGVLKANHHALQHAEGGGGGCLPCTCEPAGDSGNVQDGKVAEVE